ncbi:MAG: IMP dehydrogenase [Leuconostoc gelidum]|jgi:IMP dehydrogenase|uniref:IMP dehydrogenase n=1 Tax=Leuconostoc gelidum subsp. gelidum TaxID=1607839 RepID=A0AB35FYN1_LEUGE|nr:IMP dehydrogenase [Leuconostoc gelidum]AFS40650.1 inosine-5'-monophosphate dehydrogenase [Leuconostoc gelidum JB7]MBZ5963780.1 IMP dehydrogenase [Leuconostoc gelidum subsp. gelidum]MBZ5975377.1 IMP dehydrogenase [Leuconostoc gelidum subsp. gelidum]MBZ5976452.1 IMP dehydrogenase [Leuconostoc gelidum subsp. gelidum]MBZ5978547.1 IMP dehydrogenase [Leuconostoc gelidum subsp. gelidum]
MQKFFLDDEKPKFSSRNKFAKMGLTFDDIKLVYDQKRVVKVDEVTVGTSLTPTLNLKLPLLSAAMDTVTESRFAIALAKLGGLGVVHKNMTIAEQADEIKQVKMAEFDAVKYPNAAIDSQGRLLVAGAVGVTSDTVKRVEAMVAFGVDAIVLDSAHGHSEGVLRKVSEVRDAFPDLNIIAGNIATTDGAAALYDAGADVVKVGIGPGSICTTRIVAGIGVPQISAVRDAAIEAARRGKSIIADGGAKTSEDIVKALAAGGNAVMLGSMFSGTEETPGAVFEDNGKKYKTYRGMGSIAAMEAGSKDRYFQGEVNEAKKMVPEGIEARVQYKGALIAILTAIMTNVREDMAKMGTRTITDLMQDNHIVRDIDSIDYEAKLSKVKKQVVIPTF